MNSQRCASKFRDVSLVARMARVASICLAALAAIAISGCGTYRWTEEVQISDGRVLKVNRVEHYRGGGSIGDSCSSCVLEDSRLEFEFNGASYIWASETYAKSPMILDIIDDVPVVITTPESHGICMRDPQDYERYYYYLVSTPVASGWNIDVNVPDRVIRNRNLFFGHPSDRYLDLQSSKQWLASSGLPRHMRTLVISGEKRPEHCRRLVPPREVLEGMIKKTE